MQNAGMDKAQAGIQIARRNINLRYIYDTTLIAEIAEELKSLLMRVKVGSEKTGMKLNIQKTKIMTSGPTTSRQIAGEKVEAGNRFYFLGSQITPDGDCSQKLINFLLGRKALTNLDSLLKNRDVTLPIKGQCSQSRGFSSSHIQA